MMVRPARTNSSVVSNDFLGTPAWVRFELIWDTAMWIGVDWDMS